MKKIILFLFIITTIVVSFGWVLIFSDNIIELLSFVASIFALIVAGIALYLQIKTDKDLKLMDKNINKMEINTQDISKTQIELKDITLKTTNNVNKMYFQIERLTALNKYPKRVEFKKINESYLSLIIPLFDEETTNISIKVKPDFKLEYKVEVIKDNIGIPRKKEDLGCSFYIIKIISPSYSEVLEEKKMKKYEQSPIKEGEYYACRFDELKCSWFLGQELSLGKEYEDCYPFYVSGSSSEKAEIVPSANQTMGYNQNNYPKNEYKLRDKFIIGMDGFFPVNSGSWFRLFQKENKVFFTVEDSPLKEIYILKTLIKTQRKKFLVFENLRGHIKNENFIKNLKNRILKKMNQNDLPEKVMNSINYEKNYHIKILLE